MSKDILETILLVEDDADVRKLSELTFTEIGKFKVKTAHHGRMALEMLGFWKPDLVIMDVRMPYLDGPSTLLKMKKQIDLQDIPVIFLTGISSACELEQLIEIGALAYLLKPFDPMSICDKIRKIWLDPNNKEVEV